MIRHFLNIVLETAKKTNNKSKQNIKFLKDELSNMIYLVSQVVQLSPACKDIHTAFKYFIVNEYKQQKEYDYNEPKYFLSMCDNMEEKNTNGLNSYTDFDKGITSKNLKLMTTVLVHQALASWSYYKNVDLIVQIANTGKTQYDLMFYDKKQNLTDDLTDDHVYYICHIVLIRLMWGTITLNNNVDLDWIIPILKKFLTNLKGKKEQFEAYIEVMFCLSILGQQEFIEEPFLDLKVPDFTQEYKQTTYSDYHKRYHLAVLFAFLYASQYQRRKIAFVFKSDNGNIVNHHLWEKWRERLKLENRDCIKFFVYDYNKNIQHNLSVHWKRLLIGKENASEEDILKFIDDYTKKQKIPFVVLLDFMCIPVRTPEEILKMNFFTTNFDTTTNTVTENNVFKNIEKTKSHKNLLFISPVNLINDWCNAIQNIYSLEDTM